MINITFISLYLVFVYCLNVSLKLCIANKPILHASCLGRPISLLYPRNLKFRGYYGFGLEPVSVAAARQGL